MVSLLFFFNRQHRYVPMTFATRYRQFRAFLVFATAFFGLTLSACEGPAGPPGEEFQYLKGAIQSPSLVQAMRQCEGLFQYLKGAIQRREPPDHARAPAGFQYLKGAIQSRCRNRRRTCLRYFNTSKVRFRVPSASGVGGKAGGFQYLKGAIQSVDAH